MNTVSVNFNSSYRQKGSKFTGYLFSADHKSAFDKQYAILKKEFADATHHCYAWRLNPNKIQEYAQDDGEPGGTAGLPILNQLKSFEVINTGLVVVRYYGGTNLGKSGLIEAYTHTAQLCLQKATLTNIQLIWEVIVEYPYSEQNSIDSLIHQFDLKELDAAYTASVSLKLGCPLRYAQPLKNRLHQLSHRNIETTFEKKSYV